MGFSPCLWCPTGIFLAQCINIGTYNIRPWGWRLSLGLAAIPGTILLLGGVFLPDSPNSLVERGDFVEGKRVLQRIRGTDKVEEEFLTILAAQEVKCSISKPCSNQSGVDACLFKILRVN